MMILVICSFRLQYNSVKNRKREENVMIPQDPVMLLSFINLKLRDFYGSLKQLCDDLDVKEQEITAWWDRAADIIPQIGRAHV